MTGTEHRFVRAVDSECALDPAGSYRIPPGAIKLRCIWCGVERTEARTVNCPRCPYDDGLAYLNEVDEP